jgi:hypothetical protein
MISLKKFAADSKDFIRELRGEEIQVEFFPCYALVSGKLPEDSHGWKEDLERATKGDSSYCNKEHTEFSILSCRRLPYEIGDDSAEGYRVRLHSTGVKLDSRLLVFNFDIKHGGRVSWDSDGISVQVKGLQSLQRTEEILKKYGIYLR